MSKIIFESIQCVKHCKDASGKAKLTLDERYKHKYLVKNENIIIPLYIGLVRLYLKYVVQFWSPYLAKESEI